MSKMVAMGAKHVHELNSGNGERGEYRLGIFPWLHYTPRTEVPRIWARNPDRRLGKISKKEIWK